MSSSYWDAVYGGQQQAMNSLNSLGCMLGAQQYQQAQMQNAYQQQVAQIQQAAATGKVQVNFPPQYRQRQETKVKDEILPDISLTRVFKWAVVLLIALGLGKKVWATFGPKIEAQLHKALELK